MSSPIEVTWNPLCGSGSFRIRFLSTLILSIIASGGLWGAGLLEKEVNSSGLIDRVHKPAACYWVFPQSGNMGFATNRGSLMVGGSVTFRFRKGVDEFEPKSILFEFEPKASIFFAPSFAVGGTLLARYYKFGDFNATTTWGFGPALTYFIGGRNKKVVYPYIEGAFIFTANSHIITYSELEFGTMIMLADAVGLTASLKYRLDIHYLEGSQVEHINNIMLGIGIRTFIFK